eukprot:6472285-Amphidinium_carterae.1
MVLVVGIVFSDVLRTQNLSQILSVPIVQSISGAPPRRSGVSVSRQIVELFDILTPGRDSCNKHYYVRLLVVSESDEQMYLQGYVKIYVR